MSTMEVLTFLLVIFATLSHIDKKETASVYPVDAISLNRQNIGH